MEDHGFTWTTGLNTDSILAQLLTLETIFTAVCSVPSLRVGPRSAHLAASVGWNQFNASLIPKVSRSVPLS